MRRRRAASGCCVNVITNGLLLTPEVVDRLAPFGLNGVKITLDGDHDTHNRMRPLRGGQGTFDKIIENVRACRREVPHLDRRQFRRELRRQLSGAARFPSRAGLRRQAGARRVQAGHPRAEAAAAEGHDPAHGGRRGDGKPLNGTCMTSAGGGTSICDNCNFLDEKMSFLREETKKRGFSTADGVHMGPCEIHRRHAHTIGPDGALYACPGFTGDAQQSTGHIDGRHDERREPRGDAIRGARGVEGVQRLRVHPGLRRRLLGRGAHRAWQHAPAELPQDAASRPASSRWRGKPRARAGTVN